MEAGVVLTCVQCVMINLAYIEYVAYASLQTQLLGFSKYTISSC